MIKKFSLILDNEFYEYCKANKIDDHEKLAKKIFDRDLLLKNMAKYQKVSKATKR
jgi:hypothetical protein